ncbi:sensor histidine kinase [Lentzea flaviverrucosa]|uniref:histidine kinase n=1 Tax=Lentzea flaviverrucosa TaxID=200379 RepID=A0A1H9XT70_9PSEU|nr:histidine kinase [Lentzea flaviverrucosa]RDI19231.1 signal transduction histidine kinase [Lentzea flaviverrucosa]SES49326.1 Signal transduction histidine kinase [Lentzea flaviverrucosa]
MGERTIWEAVGRWRFLLSSWPWRAVAYVLSTPLAAAASLAVLPFALVGGPLAARPVVAVERRRLRLVRAASAGGPVSWWDVAHLLVVVLLAVPSLVLGLALVLVLALIAGPLFVTPDRVLALGFGEVRTVQEAVPFALTGLALLPLLLYVFALVAGVHSTVARALLHPSGTRLRTELVQVAQSRERLVTAFDAERRRIERDLHDGAQQRVVSLVMQLGIAKLELPPDSPAAESVAGAHAQAKQLLVELREFVHGIHPQALSDLGLPAALQELADRSPIPVTVRCHVPARPSGTVESAAYFVVTEALSNAAKHSGATRIEVAASLRHNVLTVEVTDDGRGGADTGHGSGLTGLADRCAALGGTLSLSSPENGPTTVRAEFPC